MKYNLFISYDLIAPGQHYPKVTAAIEALGSWAKIHYSLYFVSTSLTSQQACERIWQSMDANDKLLVIDARNAHHVNLPGEVSEHIRHHWKN